MRLLEHKDNGALSLTEDIVNNIPAYAILSHRWGEDSQEVTFEDLCKDSGKSKLGYQKIRFCGEQAARDGLRYFWVDTCCINKSDAVEVQKSINSMFRWYKNAAKCYVYLSDITLSDNRAGNSSSPNFESAFRSTQWFTRGWTLQELLAPSSVDFFSADYERLGSKSSFERLIHEITRVPVEALQGCDLTRFSFDERVSWVARREAKHEEDLAYSLLGICGVFLPLNYGEGRDYAFRRLREEVGKKNPKTAVKMQPKFTVPFVRDQKFVGREDIIQEITNRLEKYWCVALCGIGGIGKTQIAIEYCYLWKHRYPDRHVFWVDASTFESFEGAYRGIAKDMSIPRTQDTQNNTLTTVRDWLNKPENGTWLLVLDNADDFDLFFELNSPATKQNHQLISTLLPQNANSIIITTTRDKRIGQRLSNREEEITITPLALTDAEQLLLSRIPGSEISNDREIQILVEILGNIPLAITQAAAFIRKNSMTLQAYLKELKASDSDLQDYLDENLPDPRRYPDSENSVIRTWKLSFDQIARHSPRAADMLSLMVQLDRQAIPKELLKYKNDRSIEFNKAVGTLQAYSLIKTEKGGASFEIHRLIQLSTQRWLSLQQKQTEWKEKALQLMVEKFPSGEYGTWMECERLLLHAKCVARHAQTRDALQLQRAQLLENIAKYDGKQGNFEAACLQYKDVLQIRESELGKKHPDTLRAMNNLAAVLKRQGKYAEAETINRQTLKLKEEVFGKTHPNTLATMGNLALVLDSQGKYAEAETINRRTLELKEEMLGKKHPDTLITMGNLALVLKRQGKYAEAETINRQTLKLKEEVLGKTHPDTLTTMNNLATTLYSQGKHTKAETIIRQTLELREEVLGKTHPDTLTSVHWLAYLLKGKQEYEEATILYQRAIDGFKATLSAEHPTTINCVNNYSAMLKEAKKKAKGETR